jgi:hypothetical protein
LVVKNGLADAIEVGARHAVTAIDHREPNRPGDHVGREHDGRPAVGRGVERVLDEVREDLHQAVARRLERRLLELNIDAGERRVSHALANSGEDSGGAGGCGQLPDRLARARAHAAHDGAAAFELVPDEPRIGDRLVGRRMDRPLELLGGDGDGREGRPQLVRGAGCERAQRGELLVAGGEAGCGEAPPRARVALPTPASRNTRSATRR